MSNELLENTRQRIRKHLRQQNNSNEKRWVTSGRNEALKSDVMKLMPPELDEYQQFEFLEYLQMIGDIEKIDGCNVIFNPLLADMSIEHKCYNHGLGAIHT